MNTDDNTAKIKEFFSELNNTSISSEEKIKLLDKITAETEEDMLKTKEYAKAHNITFSEALEILNKNTK